MIFPSGFHYGCITETQHGNADVPVSPFMLNDYSRNDPTSFEFTYVLDDVKYIYGFFNMGNTLLSIRLENY